MCRIPLKLSLWNGFTHGPLQLIHHPAHDPHALRIGVVTYKSTAERAAVRAQAAEALRTGQIPSGEFSAM